MYLCCLLEVLFPYETSCGLTMCPFIGLQSHNPNKLILIITGSFLKPRTKALPNLMACFVVTRHLLNHPQECRNNHILYSSIYHVK